ncbi:MAG: tRNA lysidine(34) synthetase TilS [Bacilli bacterium]
MKLLTTINETLDLDKKKKYLLGCSFGPDSMCLLSLLLKNEFNFVIAHVNYKTRKESDLEENALTKFCEENKIKLFKKTYHKSNEKNFEADARYFRYDFFAEIYRKENCDVLLTAHHCDDSIETRIFNQQRKSYPTFEGITEETYIQSMLVKRPLLVYDKKTIMNYVNENMIPYSIDSTNLEDRHTRNKIRHTIIDKMSLALKQEAIDKISLCNEALKDLYIRITADNLYERENIKTCSSSDYYLFSHAIVNLVKNCTNLFPNVGIIKHIFEDINNGKNNKIYPIDKTYSIVLENETIMVVATAELSKKYKLNFEEGIKLLGLNVNIFKDKFPTYDIGEIYLSPLVESQNIVVNNKPKKVRRFLIDCKIPCSLRKLWPAIYSKDGALIYSPRYREEEDQFNTNILNFSCDKLFLLPSSAQYEE